MLPRVTLSFLLVATVGLRDARVRRTRSSPSSMSLPSRSWSRRFKQLQQQVATAKSQLAQAQSEYAAITGSRACRALERHRAQLPADRLAQLRRYAGLLGELSGARGEMS